ncbi:MAG: hypothetical protein ACE5FS_11030 [Paracoccaceae bacterium]
MRRLFRVAAMVLCLGPSAAAGVPFGKPVDLYSVPGSFLLERSAGGIRLRIHGADGRQGATYRMGKCRFCDETKDGCSGDGIFSLVFPGSREPMVAAICHPPEGGQKFTVYAPGRDAEKPVVDVRGDRFVSYLVMPDRLVVLRDRGGRILPEKWFPGLQADAFELERVRDQMRRAAGRSVNPPNRVNDGDYSALVGSLKRIAADRDADALIGMAAQDILLGFGGNSGREEFRRIVSGRRFWQEFGRVLAGGGVMVTGEDGSRTAIFPAAFHDWPDDLDAFGLLYGDREDAVMRAGPSETAPVLAGLYRRIVVRGPYPDGHERLTEDGWVGICTAENGCGFARSGHVRSPIDWRAVLTQSRRGADWVLETFVSGD